MSRRNLSKDELKNFDECLELIKRFVPMDLGMIKYSYLVENDGVVYLFLFKEGSYLIDRIAFCYDPRDDRYWCDQQYNRYLSGAVYGIRSALSRLSKIPYRIKCIRFSTTGFPFSEGFICDSNSENGSYDIELI